MMMTITNNFCKNFDFIFFNNTHFLISSKNPIKSSSSSSKLRISSKSPNFCSINSFLRLSNPRKTLKFKTHCNSNSNLTTTGDNKQADEVEEDDTEAFQLFQKVRDAERERVKKQEEFENKANVQLERQLVMASEWSRTLLTMRGKLKGTEWDPVNSHKIDYSEFMSLLNTKNVKFMEYSNFGQTISVILPHYKDGMVKGISEENQKEEVVFKRHIVDRMPIDCWNDVWHKLHQQLSRLQAKQDIGSNVSLRYSGTLDAIVKMIRYEGLLGFYKGMSTKIVQSVFAASVLFTVKEELVKAFTILTYKSRKIRLNALR